MLLKKMDEIIAKFLTDLRLTWQILFLAGIVLYGVSFIFYFTNSVSPRPLSYFQFIDLGSFVLAIFLAVAVFYEKRKYFSHRALQNIINKIYSQNQALDEYGLAKLLTNYLKTKLRIVWIMGDSLIILGVCFFWWTFQTKNMHIYFIVGLYSLMMNYPRKEIFSDIPFLINDVLKEKKSDR